MRDHPLLRRVSPKEGFAQETGISYKETGLNGYLLT